MPIPPPQRDHEVIFIDIDPPPVRRPTPAKNRPPSLKKETRITRISPPACSDPHQPMPTIVKSITASPSLSVTDLDIEEADLSDELILTETEYFSNEDYPTRPTIYPSPQRQIRLSPESFTYPKLDALTLTQQGEATVAHSGSIPIDYSQLAGILPSRLRTTVWRNSRSGFAYNSKFSHRLII